MLSGCRRRALTSSGDDGIGMVEVLITIVITSILGTMITLFFLASVDATRRADGQNEGAAAARATLDSWSVLLRLAVDPAGSTAPATDRILAAAPSSIQFCAALWSKAGDAGPSAPVGVRLALELGKLVEYRWTTCETMRSGNAYQVRRVLVQRATLVPGAWLVTPFAQGDIPKGNAMNGELLTSSLVVGTAEMTPDKLQLTAGLQLAFRTVSDPRRPAPVAVYSTLEILPRGS